MKYSRLSIRITLPIAFISALAIGLTALLNLGKFERTLTELESSRLQFVLGDLKSNLETGLDLGLALPSLDNAQAVIDAERKQDANILAITIYDDAGTGVFQSGDGSALADMPASWKNAAQGEKNWHLMEDAVLVVGVPLSSNIGQNAGSIVVRHSRSAHDAMQALLARQLLQASLLAILATALLVFFGITLLLRKTNRKLNHIAQTLERSLLDKQHFPVDDIEQDALLKQVIHSSDSALQDLSLVKKTLADSLAKQDGQDEQGQRDHQQQERR